MDVYAKLATKIRKLRHKKGWSQEELADRTNLHRTYISHIECGKRKISVHTLCQLAKGLSVTPSDLLDGVNL